MVFTAVLALGALIGTLILPQYFSDAGSNTVVTIYKTGTNTANGSFAASSDAPGGAKTGTAKPGDTIKWVVNYMNNTHAPASVNLKDVITGGQTYVPNSLQLPPLNNPVGSISAQYTTNGGGSWATGTPPSNANGVGYTGTSIATARQQLSTPFTVSGGSSTLNSTGGDAYNAVTRNGLIYEVYHHRTGGVVYCTQQNGTACPGWPNANAQYWSETVGAAIGTGTSFAGYTAWQNGTWINGSRMYWFANRTDGSQAGVACLDLAPTTPTSCGFYSIATNIPNPTSGGSIGSTGIPASDGNIYAVMRTGSQAVLYCVRPAGNSVCGSYTLASGVTTTSAFTVHNFGGYVFASYRTTDTSSWLTSCRTTGLGACSGTWPVTGAPSGDGAPPVLGPRLSTSGALTQVCSVRNTTTAYSYPCWNLDGSVSSTKYTTFAYYNTSPGSAGDVWTSGTRIYSNYQGSIYCFDYASVAADTTPFACSGFTGLGVANTRNYTVRPANDIAPNCLIATGDGGQITIFNAISGGACLTSSNTQTLDMSPSGYYCGSGMSAFRAWGTMSLPGLVSGTYVNSTVTLRDQNNNIITAGGVTYNNYTLAAGGSINLSQVPTSVTWIRATVRINGVNNPTGVQNAQIAVSWEGDPPEMCFQTTVPSYGCDVTSTTVSNSANAVTSSTAGSDSPGGNSTGLATFNVQPNAPACTLDLTQDSEHDRVVEHAESGGAGHLHIQDHEHEQCDDDERHVE
ncbi:hypothetical protein ACRAWB_13785 [Leifsonia poae]|uniref:hypothetical protein n=1 Tax=Leifsonia poae TaxID=110933 RepID=UPI003D681063